MLEARKQKRVRTLARLDRILAPDPAPTLWFAPTPQVVRLTEPQARLGLSRDRLVVPVWGGLVSAHCEHTAERAVVRDGPQMLADRLHSPDAVLKGNRLQFVEHALDV